MTQRPVVIAANWKMNKLRAEAMEYVSDLATWIDDHLESPGVQVIVAPTYTSLEQTVEQQPPFGVFAQNMHQADTGAFTGEISPAMLRDIGVSGVILGHSERRQYFNETDEALADKVQAALAFQLRPMLCVGETLAQRKAGDAKGIVEKSLRTALDGLDAEDVASMLYVAYEPVWAIGTGETATPEQAQQMHAHIRSVLGDLFGLAIAAQIPVLYGGSVKADNALELLSASDIDGALVGGAALEVESFSGIIQAARRGRIGTGWLMSQPGVRPVALVILDGWGQADESPGNAVRFANTPTFDRLWEDHPHTLMSASGLDVGLPEGQMGNSEVGHLNLGAGRVVYQDLTRIDKAVVEGELRSNVTLVAAIDATLASGGSMHVVGLCSHGGVHSSLMHIGRIVWQCAEAGIPHVLVHAITDGRDVGPDSSLTDIPEFAAALDVMALKTGVDVHIATVTGRYWAMDRDKRWDRTHKAWEAIVHGIAPTTTESPAAAVQAAHAAGTTDEFVEPTIIGSAAPVNDGDGVIFANFRPDRMRQLVHAFADGSDFAAFDRGRVPKASLSCMCEYDEALGLPLLYQCAAPD